MSDLCFLTAVELADRIRRRQVSVSEVVRAHLAQIERVNPRVNAIVTLTAERALEDARAKDAALARGEAPGPLFGLPVAHKDLVPTKGIRTTYGSPIYRDHVPDEDGLIVERLRAAGAVTLGKTNTPEFGAGSQTFNEVFGRTLNPYDLAKTCGGSSGGAAVALACGMVPIADGSDTGGSLRNPAAFCNVVGLRPALGRVPAWPASMP
jgi:amidase